jgi:murein DD-endopeptidase MepM/ murein hydrolase activator NlpD
MTEHPIASNRAPGRRRPSLAALAVLTGVALASTPLAAALAGSPAYQATDPVCANPPRTETIGPRPVAGGGVSTETERPLRQGMKGYGDHVCNLTGSLASAGYTTVITSQFTSEVATNLRRFQRDHSLAANGVYDWGTETVLTRCLGTGPTAVSSPRLDCGAPWGRASPVVPAVSGVSGYRFPLKVFLEFNRVDRGQDMESTLHGPYLAIGAGTVLSAATGFPGVVVKLRSGPDAGKMVYYGHTSRSYVKVGQKVHAGQVLGLVGHQGASYDPSPYHVEVGFLTAAGQVAPGTKDEHWASTGAAMNRLLHRIAPKIIAIAPKPPCARAHPPSYC